MMTTVKINRVTASASQLKDLCEKSACTMAGYQKEELELYVNELSENGFIKGDAVTVYETTGAEMGNVLGTDYPSDLNLFIIDLDAMDNLPKFAVGLRFERGYRWLDDIVANANPSYFGEDESEEQE